MKIPLILVLCVSPIWTLPKGSRIIGGREAFAGEFPYAAAIYKSTASGNYFGTGSLLSSEWILTAGQCVEGARSFTILLGTHKLSGDSETVQKFATETFVLHPDYNPQTLENDIGLIKFREPVYMTTYIRNIYLPYADLSDSTAGVAYGWGQVNDDDADLSDTLNYVTLMGVSDAECRMTYGNQISKNMACFEGNYNEGTCFGDSGSPIILDISRGYTVVVAISSFFSGNGCESTDPSGYTKVYPYNDWINNKSKQQQTQEWILTASDCVDGATLFDIHLGSTSLNSNDQTGRRFTTEYYKLHPNYNPLTLENNIGLIKLRAPVEFSDYLKPVDFLPTGDLAPYTGTIGLGWGQVNDETSGLVDNLNCVSLTVLSNEECKMVYGQQIADDMVCVDGNYNEGTCNGDSGGPLVQNIGRGFSMQVAVSSFLSGNGCESTDPSGYTRVYPHIDWIYNITGM